MLKFLAARELEVLAEATDPESGYEECRSWAATTAPILMAAIRSLGAKQLHQQIMRDRQGRQQRETLLTSILDNIVSWMASASLALQSHFAEASTANEHRLEALGNARQRVKVQPSFIWFCNYALA